MIKIISFFAIYNTITNASNKRLLQQFTDLEVYGAYKQKCKSPQSDFACQFAQEALTDQNSGVLECGVDYSCCLCGSITCGSQAKYCDTFKAGADYSAFGVQNINIIGEVNGNGAVIDCNGQYACGGTRMTGTWIDTVRCSSDGSCANALMEFTDSKGITCGKGSCIGATVKLKSNRGGELICAAETACLGATIEIDGILDVKCNGPQACENTNIVVNDPIDAANMRGTAQGPDIYFQSLVANNKYYQDAPDIIANVMKEFGAITGREYKLFDYYGAKDADKCIVMMGSGCNTAEQTIDAMNASGEKVGLLKVHLYRPFSINHLLSELPTSINKIAVMDRTREDGALSQPLHLDITSSLQKSGRINSIDVLTGGQYGLSSKEFTPAMVRAIYNNLSVPNPKIDYVIGINDDVTNTSLDYASFELGSDISELPPNTTECMFWGMGSDGTVGANKQSIKDIAENTDLFVQAHFAYTAHKSGGVTCSHLRFGPNEIKAEYEIAQQIMYRCIIVNGLKDLIKL